MKQLTADQKTKKIDLIAEKFAEIMVLLNMNIKDASLKDTPKRVAKMYVTETCSALHTEPPVITTFPNKDGQYDQILVARDITLNSMCEHHFVPFIGKCHIAYKPGKRYAGLSKFNRTAQYFASKPQVQERLGTEILEHLKNILQTEDVAVIIDCKHFCVCTRGVKDPNSSTVTSHLGGIFKKMEVRTELFNLINLK